VEPLPTIGWTDRGTISCLDQTRLPVEEVLLDLESTAELREAILSLRVRGAPAIGIAAAYGVALAARLAAETSPGALPTPDRVPPLDSGTGGPRGSPGAAGELAPETAGDAARRRARGCLAGIEAEGELLRAVRPTAVNLAWALDRVLARLRAAAGADAAGPASAPRPPGGDCAPFTPERLAALALEEARAIHAEDLAMSRAMGEHGAALLPDGSRVLTHCNTGGLATGGLGTALAVVFAAQEQGKAPRVFVDETRPLLQGARLTMWELRRAGIRATLIVDGAAAWAMKRRRIDAVLVGADRVAANGDTANKIGTYGLAIAAARHGVPFYVVAPSSTFDPALPSGEAIPIEERSAQEVLACGRGGGPAPGRGAPAGSPASRGSAPEDTQAATGASVWNPAFDVTPAELIAAWVTEAGVRRRG